ncbi:MAG: flagellar hook-associated protein FlgL [Terriglobales bacterium]
MFTRITTELMNNSMLQGLNQTEQAQNDSLTQVETQRRVNVPSDDPAAAALFTINQSAGASATQYLQNINSLNGRLQTGDSALSSAVSMLNRAITLGTNGATGTLSAQDRSVLGQEVTKLQKQLIGVANSTFQGSYIFSGTAANLPAYVADGTQPDGVRYLGNAATNQVEVAPGTQVQINLPGSSIFQNGSGSVFQALQDLKTALNSNDPAGAQTAVNEISGALDQLSQQRVFYGTTLDRLTTTSTFLQNEQLNLTQQQTTLVGADLATALTQLSSAETSRSAILAAAARISPDSLINLQGP